MQLKIYFVNAFTNKVFAGNPAAVVPLYKWLEKSLLQKIAAENNVSETAFFVPTSTGYHIRWFTPVDEVPLCGHATLASAFIIFNNRLGSSKKISFESLSGFLHASINNSMVTLDFPTINSKLCKSPKFLTTGLGLNPLETLVTRSDPNYYAVFESEESINSISPNLSLLEKLHPYGVVITAKGSKSDFVSRYFVPSFGIPEDPVTGSTHCALTPYWAKKLNKNKLHARQISKRGGDLFCEISGDRVHISGNAVLYLEGHINI